MRITTVPKTAPQPALLDTVQTMAYLGISRATLQRLVQRGQVPSIKIGRARRFPVAQLDAWIAGRGTAPAE